MFKILCNKSLNSCAFPPARSPQEVLNNSLYIYELTMQGIYQGYPVMLHDKVWTVILTLSQDSTGRTHFNKAIELIERSGNGAVIKK